MHAALPRAFALLWALGSLQAQAADLFTVNVPVEFKSLHPEVLSVDVICRLRGKDPTTGNLVYYAKKLDFAGAMGKNKALKPVNGDIAAQTLKFVFSTEDFEPAELSNLALVTMADCNFGLRTKDGSFNPTAVSPGAAVIAPKPGAPFNSSATASF